MEATVIIIIGIILLVGLVFTYNAYREVKRENFNLKSEINDLKKRFNLI